MKKEEEYFCDKCSNPLKYDDFYIKWVCYDCIENHKPMRK